MGFFGPRRSDYVCLDQFGGIAASGTLPDMLRLAREKNYGVGQLTPVRYAILERKLVPGISEKEYRQLVASTEATNALLEEQFGDIPA